MTMVEGGSRITRGVRFVDELERHGGATAVVDADGTHCSYAALARRADEVAARLGTGRRLVMVEATNDLEGIVRYLGALRGGHVVLLVGADDPRAASIVETHDPAVILGSGGHAIERRSASDHELHPDLALLLSTSGSTGSPKLVRLSHDNVESNAAAISEYLGLRSDDRAITTLPLQYCYGLSVLHSHLAAGASIVCSSASVVDPCFWDAVDRHGVTGLAGVPHTYELLERSGFPERSHPSLRILTQAGGRMDPDLVRRYHELGRRRGFDLYVMYGQTEATARMAYLPPALLEARPGAVGIAVPGGSFRLEPVEGVAPHEGELVYTGPNVMLGYATSPADLALGRTVTELRTGDLARIDEAGVVEIVGRRREFVKLFGLRIDLRQVQRALGERGIRAECAGDDSGLAVAVAPGAEVEAVRTMVCDQTDLPRSAVRVAAVAELPRLASGKLDRLALQELVRAVDAPPEPDTTSDSVTALLGRLLGRDVGPDDTFVSLGGDSLTYVEASIHLEALVGRVPESWHLTPVAELEQLRRPPGARRSLISHVETGVVLRAIAIVLIVGNHTRSFIVPGGAHVLFAAAGFNMARFQLRSGAWGRSLARIVVPSALWIGGVAAVSEDFDLAHVVLLHGWIGGDGRWIYWFIEALVQVLVIVAVAMHVPAVQRLERRYPLGLPSLLLLPALAVRFDLVELASSPRPVFHPPEIAWIFLLGWAAAQARTTAHRLAVSAVAVAAVPGFFAQDSRNAVLLGGLLLLVWVPTLPMPRGAAQLLGPLASASLYIYLSHVQVHPLVSGRSPLLGLVLSLGVGVAIWRLTQPIQHRLERRAPR